MRYFAVLVALPQLKPSVYSSRLVERPGELLVRPLSEPLLTPIFGRGFFVLCQDGVAQTVIFDYLDKTKYYWSLLEAGDVEALRREETMIERNMQRLVDEEHITFNGRRVKPRVLCAKISCDLPGRVSFVFSIRWPLSLRRGENVYENVYEPEEAEYSYQVIWYLPRKARNVRSNFGVPVELRRGNVLLFYVKRGYRTPGREELRFEL
ncbi:MAG: hypothetical protein QXU97_00165 [Fervidicoccaceae archaeon]